MDKQTILSAIVRNLYLLLCLFIVIVTHYNTGLLAQYGTYHSIWRNNFFFLSLHDIETLILSTMEEIITNYKREDIYNQEKIAELMVHYREILRLLGEDPEREGLIKTPERVAKAMSFITKGYAQDPIAILQSAMFKEEYQQMVLVKDIELFSVCEHHMLPFIGKAHVAYIPNGYITGLSKIARVVECFARRLQVQERLTVQIRDSIQQALNPAGVAVVIEASHTCMQMRGVEKQRSVTTTSAFTGCFLSDLRTREEFMQLIK